MTSGLRLFGGSVFALMVGLVTLPSMVLRVPIAEAYALGILLAFSWLCYGGVVVGLIQFARIPEHQPASRTAARIAAVCAVATPVLEWLLASAYADLATAALWLVGAVTATIALRAVASRAGAALAERAAYRGARIVVIAMLARIAWLITGAVAGPEAAHSVHLIALLAAFAVPLAGFYYIQAAFELDTALRRTRAAV